MIICPKCGKQLTDGTKFCGGCGTKMEERFSLTNCEKETMEKKPWKKITREMYLFGGIGAGAICVLIMMLVCFLRGNSASDYAFYVKEKELFFADLSDPEPWQITSRLVDGSVDSEGMRNFAYSAEGMCCVSRDGKTIFYPDRFSGDINRYYEYGYSIYYRSATRPEEEPVRIDTDIDVYLVNDDATLVTYRKVDGSIYQYDIKKDEKIKICDELGSDWQLWYMVSEDGNRVWYEDAEHTLYFWYRGEKEKIDSNVSDVCYVSENKEWMVYEKEGALYRKQYGEDKKRITPDVGGVLNVYETGEVYFWKWEADLTLMDFVQDDMEREDETANVLRESLLEQVMAGQYSLYYFDGEEEKPVADASVIWSCCEAYSAISFGKYDDSGIGKIKLSELRDVNAFYNEVKERLNDPERTTCCIALKDKVTEIGNGFNVDKFVFDADGETAYFIDEVGNSQCGDLYRVDIAGDKVQKPKMYDTDVVSYIIGINSQGQIVYFKDYEYEKGGELYIDGELVDYDVKSVSYKPDAKKSFYYTDLNEQYSGTLKAYAGNKSETIAEDVYSYIVLADGSVICFYDYNSYEKGDLGLYQKGKMEIIGEDVYTYTGIGNSVLYIRDYNRDYFRGDLYLYKNGRTDKVDEDVMSMTPYRVQ